MNEQLKANQNAWNEMATIHAGGAYPVKEFIAGTTGIKPNVPDDLGDVTGKSILHLQCHFGMDSLMWVRQGARVTGVDFSPVAIAEARKLSETTGLKATFVESEMSRVTEVLDGEFDIVLTYFGTIVWLPELESWAKAISHFLKPGGFFYIADGHPTSMMYEIPKGETAPRLVYKYFTNGVADVCEGDGTYADRTAETKYKVSYEWMHTFDEIITALTGHGLVIEYLHEFPYTFFDVYNDADTDLLMYEDEDGWWHMKEGEGQLPMMFSIKASKP